MPDRDGDRYEPVSEENKHAADEIEAAVTIPASIEEKMMLEAAELEEVEYECGVVAEPAAPAAGPVMGGLGELRPKRPTHKALVEAKAVAAVWGEYQV